MLHSYERPWQTVYIVTVFENFAKESYFSLKLAETAVYFIKHPVVSVGIEVAMALEGIQLWKVGLTRR